MPPGLEQVHTTLLSLPRTSTNQVRISCHLRVGRAEMISEILWTFSKVLANRRIDLSTPQPRDLDSATKFPVAWTDPTFAKLATSLPLIERR